MNNFQWTACGEQLAVSSLERTAWSGQLGVNSLYNKTLSKNSIESLAYYTAPLVAMVKFSVELTPGPKG